MTMAKQCCNLSNRSLTDYIPPTKFRSKTLILDNNQLSGMRNIKYCTSLQQLSICYNRIEDMTPVSFLHDLRLLHLIDNDICKITGVEECAKLEELNLSRNCLRSFTGLYHVISLTKLDLSYNCISSLADISSLALLKELYLHGNEISTLESAPLCLPTCICVLSLADNRISDIGQLAYLTRLRMLESLSLAGNDCAVNNSTPYQIFTVMCCPTLKHVDQKPVSPEHREHARSLEKKMLLSGDSSFSAIRDERPRLSGLRGRSKTDVSSYQSKENMSHAANIFQSSILGNDVTSHEIARERHTLVEDSSSNSGYSAYDEYNDRPASSGAARVRSRRSSEVRSPLPSNWQEEARGRSLSLFNGSSRHNRVEEEMESDSVYVGVEDDIRHCLGITNVTSSQHHVTSSQHHVTSSDEPENTTLTSSHHSELEADSRDIVCTVPAAFFVPLTSSDNNLSDLTLCSPQDIGGVIRIQAVWRGYSSRKQYRNLTRDLALRRYQAHFTVMTGQIEELRQALQREVEVSSFYRHLLLKVCAMARSKRPPTRSSISQTRRPETTDCETQTRGLISALLTSLAPVDSCSSPAREDRRSSPESFKSPFSDLLIRKKSRSYPGNESDCYDNSNNYTSREGEELKKQFESPDFAKIRGFPRPVLFPVTDNVTPVTDNVTPVTDHVTPVTDSITSTPDDATPAREVTAGFIKNTITIMRNSLLRKSPDSQDFAPSNQNLSPSNQNLSSSNQRAESQSNDLRLEFQLDQFKSVEEIINEQLPKNND